MAKIANRSETYADEYGNDWLCKKWDVAFQQVSSLKRMGFREIVLPLSTWSTGDIPDWKGVEVNPLTLATQRMRDCIFALTEGGELEELED